MSRQTDALIAEAKRYLGTVEEPKTSNRGLSIDYWIKEAGLDPKGAFPWCAAYVGQCGRQALGALWPCPRTASVMTLIAWAAAGAKNLMHPQPEPGDLFVLWSTSLNRFAHVGIVTKVNKDLSFETLEGNTNDGGSRDGFGVFARHRTLHPRDRFIRWEAAL